MEHPQSGGTYIRDPETGALIPDAVAPAPDGPHPTVTPPDAPKPVRKSEK